MERGGGGGAFLGGGMAARSPGGAFFVLYEKGTPIIVTYLTLVLYVQTFRKGTEQPFSTFFESLHPYKNIFALFD